MTEEQDAPAQSTGPDRPAGSTPSTESGTAKSTAAESPTGESTAGESGAAIGPGRTDAVVPLGPLDAGTPGAVAPPPDYSDAGVPSLDFVRDKIEGRYARSLGSTELAAESPEARTFEEQAAQREDAAQEKLAAIRRSLRDGSSS